MKRILFILTLPLLLVGCGTPDPSGTSNLKVLLTDAPASEASSLTVAFGRIELVPSEDSDKGLITISEEIGSIDVLQLRNGGIETLGELTIPDGVYSQVRLVVESAEIAFDNGADVYDVKIPSGQQTGLKINIEPALVAEAGETSQVILDFDAERAVIETPPGSNNYLLKPTAIRAVTHSGVVEGAVVDATTVAAVEGALVEVHNMEGELVTSTVTEADGSFKFITLVEGTYDIEVTAPGYGSQLVEDVGVVAGETASLGEINLTLAPAAP